MERVEYLKNKVVEVLNEYADYLRGANLPEVNYEVLVSEKHNKIQLLAMGWDKSTRIFNIIFHVDIINNKVWIQEDNTLDGLAALLLEKGLSKQEIVLAYYPDHHRQYTEFAVA
jgi:hypothetical protein